MSYSGILVVLILVSSWSSVRGARVISTIHTQSSGDSVAAVEAFEEAVEVQETIAFLEKAVLREQSRTDANSQREALGIFHELVAPWEYKGVSGSDPLTCGEHTYTGPVSGLGSGAHGVTVMMHRGSSAGPKVVAKFWKGKPENENLNYECQILQRLEKSGVANVVRCEAACQHNGNIMIVISPVIEGGPQQFIGELQQDSFESPAALRKAVTETLRIGFAMLDAEVTNIDQGHNILYLKDGTTTFIDMGLARYLPESQLTILNMWHADRFLDALLNKVPSSWWQNGEAERILNALKWPSTPAYLETEPPDFAHRIRKKIVERGADWLFAPTTAPPPKVPIAPPAGDEKCPSMCDTLEKCRKYPFTCTKVRLCPVCAR